MKKINILYKEDNKTLVESVFIYINGKEFGEVKKNQVKTIELENGDYEIEIYSAKITNVNTKGANVERAVWAKEKITVNDSDMYYIFKSPLLVNNTGKLESVSEEKFNKIVKKSNFLSSKTGVAITIIILAIIYILIEFIF